MIARVFPRQTSLSPDDPLAFFDPPGLFESELGISEVHVSVAFTFDMPRAEWLARQWERIAPVRIGGPGAGTRGEEFIPGMYLKKGVVITSRGCPNRCFFCSAWKRDGGIRELEIRDGWIIQDDNLLACSPEHVRAVFAMLARQAERPRFTGGLEARRLTPEIVRLLAESRPADLFFAYDTPDDLEPLREAGRMIREAGLLQFPERGKRHLRAYVLVGYPGDTIEAAEIRLRETFAAGFLPCAMLYRSERGFQNASLDWKRFVRGWIRVPAMMRLLQEGAPV